MAKLEDMQSSSPAEIAARALRVTLDEVAVIEEIKHGLTNDSWRVRAGAQDVVVRVSRADEHALRIDRASEARILRAAADAGVGAPVLFCDHESQVLITRYLGPPWSAADAKNAENIRRLARLLRRLHQMTPPEGVRTVDLSETLAGYVQTLETQGKAPELRAATQLERSRAAVAALSKRSESRLCHNDVHHLNIVDAESLHLIDWEYAGLGEPLFDLASACVYHSYSRSQREALLCAYGDANASIDSHLNAAIWLFEYIRDLWSAVRELTRSSAREGAGTPGSPRPRG